MRGYNRVVGVSEPRLFPVGDSPRFLSHANESENRNSRGLKGGGRGERRGRERGAGEEEQEEEGDSEREAKDENEDEGDAEVMGELLCMSVS